MTTRRDFTAGLLLAAATRSARAQAPAKQHRIAVIAAVLPPDLITETEGGTPWRAFFEELRRLGYLEGENLIVERYSPEGDPRRYADLARQVVSRKPELIVTGTGFLAQAFAAATSTIPIVSALGDAYMPGLAGTLARPGGNVTGASRDAGIEIWGKRLQILKEAIPSASRFVYLALRAAWEGAEGQELRKASRLLVRRLADRRAARGGDRLGISACVRRDAEGATGGNDRLLRGRVLGPSAADRRANRGQPLAGNPPVP